MDFLVYEVEVPLHRPRLAYVLLQHTTHRAEAHEHAQVELPAEDH